MPRLTERRRASILVAVTVALSAASFATNAVPASANQPTVDITLTTTTLPAMHPGQTAWVSTLWQGTSKAADDFQMTATSTGATISYPTNTSPHSSFYGSSTLWNNATDFAALKIRINDNATSTVTINISASYDLRNNNGNNSSSTPMTKTAQITVPVQAVTGASIGANTTSLTPVAHGRDAWQQFSVTGRKPGVTNLTATVAAPAGITVSYPAEGANTGPSQTSTLGVDTTDTLGFKTAVDSSVAPGSYSLTVTMSFGSGQQQQATVALVVT